MAMERGIFFFVSRESPLQRCRDDIRVKTSLAWERWLFRTKMAFIYRVSGMAVLGHRTFSVKTRAGWRWWVT